MDESAPSIFLSIRNSFTPTVLFLLLNLVIFTIVLSSKTRRDHKPDPGPNPRPHPGRNDHLPGPTGLERVRSIGLFRFGSRDIPQPEPDNAHRHIQPPSVLERVRSIIRIPQPELDNTHSQIQPPSVLERVKSIIRNPKPETHHEEEDDMDHHFRRIQSESAAARSKPVMAEEKGTLRKLASTLSWRATEPEPKTIRRRAPAREVAEVEEEEEVDARADDFINRFRQQLHLQRLKSIIRNKEILTRGK